MKTATKKITVTLFITEHAPTRDGLTRDGRKPRTAPLRNKGDIRGGTITTEIVIPEDHPMLKVLPHDDFLRLINSHLVTISAARIYGNLDDQECQYQKTLSMLRLAEYGVDAEDLSFYANR